MSVDLVLRAKAPLKIGDLFGRKPLLFRVGDWLALRMPAPHGRILISKDKEDRDYLEVPLHPLGLIEIHAIGRREIAISGETSGQ